MDYLKGLNPEQQRAVLAIDGPLLVLAGAGAGKTRVIVERIRQIVRNGVAPESILAITFTNKAAGEMRSRVLQGNALDRGSSRRRLAMPFVSTFHSLGLTLIKENRKLLGLTHTPAIYDRSDSLRAMKQALLGAGREDFEPRAALAAVSHQKGNGVLAAAYAEEVENPRERVIATAWLAYERALREQGALDFDDLLLRAVELLEKHREVREHCHGRWRYIHVDEYQDTNPVQERLMELLVGKERNICVVGDPDQTIYGWRGAAIENILHFEKKYPGAEVVVLEENYRSTDTILRAANSLIGHNTGRPQKVLRTKNPAGEMLSLYVAGDGGDEAAFVARTVKECIADGARPRDFAVLYRANFQSRALEEKLLDARIPYQVLGTRFFERKEVKDVLSYIRAALYGTSADIARAVQTPPRGIGKVTLLKFISGVAVAGKVGEKVAAFERLLKKLKQAADEVPPSELLRMAAAESGIEKMLKEDKVEGAERLANVYELAALASRYQTLEDFLESVALASDQDELKEEQDAVRLMTVHAAKGLEFPYVFIVGLEEGLFPYVGEQERQKDLEEERRLMYVALTRGQKRIFLSWAMMRTVFGSTDIRSPSSFLSELPGELLENEVPERLGKTIYLD